MSEYDYSIPTTSADEIVACFTEHAIYPTNRARGYFDRRRAGKLGCTEAGAIAILAGLRDLRGSHRSLLYRASDFACGAFAAWWRYGLADGWAGVPINRQEPEGRDVRLWKQYEAGYSVGRDAALKLGLVVPEVPMVITNREEYLAHYLPAKGIRT